MGHPTENAEPVVHRDDDDIPFASQTIEPVERGRTADERTAVNPYYDRPLSVGFVRGWDRDVEVEAASVSP